MIDEKDFNSLNKPRSKKLHAKVDFSAMVSISFLLIIFYMVMIEISKPKAMNLGLPDMCGEITCGISCGPRPDRVITILLDDNNKVITYQGLLEVPDDKPKTLSYGKEGIRKELLKKNKIITEQLGDQDRGAIVIIKPSKKSNFGNLISILDEMAITNIQTYAIVNDFTPDEAKLLAMN
ncbi:biopolymer transporter ExbD [Flavobacterium sp.]|uniref:ExbD/TolR family protein n=1 Tax=Flavobacterium sp. TaxID=239 RepID=UPI00260354E5|nr:biopolymer transporter ExbD [Flavobacterium sp.]